MACYTRLTPAICVAALIAPSVAQADVTAQQVWDDWQSDLALWGTAELQVGAETMDGDTLTVSDVKITMVGPDATAEATLPEVRFTETGDGTVVVTASESYPLTLVSTAPDAPESEVAISVTQTGLEILVSGTPENTVYDISADRYALTLDQVTEAGKAIKADAMLALASLTGSYTAVTAENGDREMGYDMAADRLDLLLDVPETEDAGAVTLSGKVSEVTLDGETAIPAAVDFEAPESALMQGLRVSGGYTAGPADYIFSFKDGDESGAGTVSAEDSSLRFSFAADEASYDSRTTGLAVELSDSPLPFPVKVGIKEYGLGVKMPLSASETPQDFSARVTLDSLTVNDEVWGMIDPLKALPREPATLIAELTGSATLPHDLADPEQAEKLAEDEMPVMLNSLSLDRLTVVGAGASVEGDGAFTFDNSDMTTFEGFPRPEGKIDLRLKGLNTLIENLAKLGVVPSDQVMGARMMLGLFTTPVGEDELTSTIEVNAEGHVIANGQRLQ